MTKADLEPTIIKVIIDGLTPKMRAEILDLPSDGSNVVSGIRHYSDMERRVIKDVTASIIHSNTRKIPGTSRWETTAHLTSLGVEVRKHLEAIK